jgi:hypothetical protein
MAAVVSGAIGWSTRAHGLGSDGGVFRLSSSRGPNLMRARTMSGRSSRLARITAKTTAMPMRHGAKAKTTYVGIESLSGTEEPLTTAGIPLIPRT